MPADFRGRPPTGRSPGARAGDRDGEFAVGIELGRELGLGADELSDLYLSGLLHDVGKIGIKDSVLHKQDPLSAAEQEHVQQHVTLGYWILAGLRQVRNLVPGVLYHHERYDGTGYPDGLSGEAIPLPAR